MEPDIARWECSKQMVSTKKNNEFDAWDEFRFDLHFSNTNKTVGVVCVFVCILCDGECLQFLA